MSLTFQLDPIRTPALRGQILNLWADVANAGGAVGFLPPVAPDAIRPALARRLFAVAEGQSRLLVGCDEEGEVVAAAFFTFNSHPQITHWAWLNTVMVHPRYQGRGYGRDLMAAAAQAARGFDGIEAIRLTCKGGTGLERFYTSCGYKEVGRVPGGIRVAPGDDRDDVIMLLMLD